MFTEETTILISCIGSHEYSEFPSLILPLSNSMIYKTRRFGASFSRGLHNPYPGLNQSISRILNYFFKTHSGILLPSTARPSYKCIYCMGYHHS